MQVELEELQPKLVIASEENESMMKVIYHLLHRYFHASALL